MPTGDDDGNYAPWLFLPPPGTTSNDSVFDILGKVGTTIANVGGHVQNFLIARDNAANAIEQRNFDRSVKVQDQELARYRIGVTGQIEKYRLDGQLAQARAALGNAPGASIFYTAAGQPNWTIVLLIVGGYFAMKKLK